MYVFQYDDASDDWMPMGEILNAMTGVGDTSRWHFGYSLVASANGEMITIGNPGGLQGWEGRTHIYRNNGDATWSRVGAEIEGTGDGDQIGSIVALSQDGSIVATAANGHIEVYEMDGVDQWTQLGANIDVINSADGRPVSMALSTGPFPDSLYITAVFNFVINEKLNCDLSVLLKYPSDRKKWTILFRDRTWVVAADQSLLEFKDGDFEVLFKQQGATASSYSYNTFGPTVVEVDPESLGIETRTFTVNIEVPVAAPMAAPVAAPVATPVAAPVATPVAAPVATPVAAPVAPSVAAPVAPSVSTPTSRTGLGKGSKSKGGKGSKSSDKKGKGSKSDKSSNSYAFETMKQLKEPKSHKHYSYSKKSGKKSAK